MDRENIRNDIINRVLADLRWRDSRKRAIIYMYYFEKMTLSNIGDIFDISKERVAQLRNSAIKEMQEIAKNKYNLRDTNGLFD